MAVLSPVGDVAGVTADHPGQGDETVEHRPADSGDLCAAGVAGAWVRASGPGIDSVSSVCGPLTATSGVRGRGFAGGSLAAPGPEWADCHTLGVTPVGDVSPVSFRRRG